MLPVVFFLFVVVCLFPLALFLNRTGALGEYFECMFTWNIYVIRNIFILKAVVTKIKNVFWIFLSKKKISRGGMEKRLRKAKEASQGNWTVGWAEIYARQWVFSFGGIVNTPKLFFIKWKEIIHRMVWERQELLCLPVVCVKTDKKFNLNIQC